MNYQTASNSQLIELVLQHETTLEQLRQIQKEVNHRCNSKNIKN
ncbi:MAG: hypothetical protein ACRCWQ_08290 [Bacilli bacterium]